LSTYYILPGNPSSQYPYDTLQVAASSLYLLVSSGVLEAGDAVEVIEHGTGTEPEAPTVSIPDIILRSYVGNTGKPTINAAQHSAFIDINADGFKMYDLVVKAYSSSLGLSGLVQCIDNNDLGIERCLFKAYDSDIDCALNISGGSGHRIINTVTSGMPFGGINFFSSTLTQDVIIANNIIYDVIRPVAIRVSRTTRGYVINNIIHTAPGDGINFGSDVVDVIQDYNCLYNIEGDEYAGEAVRGLNNLDKTSHGGQGPDPLLKDPANDDFTLVTRSPCVDTGFLVQGVTPEYDYYNNLRGSLIDIGVYEYPQSSFCQIQRLTRGVGHSMIPTHTAGMANHMFVGRGICIPPDKQRFKTHY